MDEKQHLADEPRRGAFNLFTLWWDCTANGVAHHPPVYAELSGDTDNRSDALVILAPDLLEKFHFGSPIQPAAPSGWLRPARTKLHGSVLIGVGQISRPKWAKIGGQTQIPPGGVPEPTIIYLEGDRLTLVHYCEAGNRPRMVARKSSDPNTVEFDFVDISGSTKPAYLRRFVFTVIDADPHTEDWTFMLPGDKLLHAHFDLKRANGSGGF